MKKERLYKRATRMLLFVMLFIMMTTTMAFAEDNKFATAWGELMAEWNTIIAGVAGFGALTSLLVFIVHMFQLATLGTSHPIIRKKIMNDILISGITTAMLGATGLIFWIVYQTSFFG